MRTAAFLLLATLPGLTAGCGKTTPATPGNDPAPGPAAASDKDRLQGMWAVESFEGNPDDKPPPEELKSVRFVFEGDKLKITIGGEDREASSFTLDTASNPKGIILTRLDKDGQPARGFTPKGEGEIRKMEAIYKFEGDKLVIAMSEGPGAAKAPRPTEFKPKAGRRPPATAKAGGSVPVGEPAIADVFVVTFKKTTEPAPKGPPRGTGTPTAAARPTAKK